MINHYWPLLTINNPKNQPDHQKNKTGRPPSTLWRPSDESDAVLPGRRGAPGGAKRFWVISYSKCDKNPAKLDGLILFKMV